MSDKDKGGQWVTLHYYNSHNPPIERRVSRYGMPCVCGCGVGVLEYVGMCGFVACMKGGDAFCGGGVFVTSHADTAVHEVGVPFVWVGRLCYQQCRYSSALRLPRVRVAVGKHGSIVLCLSKSQD